MTEPVWLLQPTILAVQHIVVARFGGTDGIRDKGLLTSALQRPRNLYHYENCESLPRLAASYAAGLIQNHPFVDGNKRIGFMAAYIFLDVNGQPLNADELSATAMTLALAASEIDESAYANWLADNS